MTIPAMTTFAPYEALTLRQKCELIRAQLDTDRQSFKSHWQDCNDFIKPRRARFFVTDVNRGNRRTQKIIDSTGTMALRTLSSGMMSGVTSPARPWFRLTVPDQDVAERGDVKQWLYDCTERMRTVFLRSNLYNMLPVLYSDLGLFGTSFMSELEDAEQVVRFDVYPVGSYMIANDNRGKVGVLIRDFEMTVQQVVDEFCQKSPDGKSVDLSKLSTSAQQLWSTGMRQAWLQICHVIKLNDEYDPNKALSRYKKYTSIYYERGTTVNQSAGEQQNLILRQEGFDEFPGFGVRWEVTGEDVYGTDWPGATALGDIRQLQYGEKKSAQAIDLLVRPPMAGPTALRASKASLLPGDITYVDTREGQQGYKPVYEIEPNIDKLEMKQQAIRNRIQRVFYEDLFLMLSQSDRKDITAREIDERHEEKLLALGPVLERLNQDLLDPLIDRTFMIMLRRGLIPQPPQAIQGQTLKAEYISVMAQAQKLVGIASLDRFTQMVSQFAAVDPTVLDKVDRDELVQEYGEATGIPPKIIVPEDVVQQIRAQRQQAQEAQQKAEMLQQAAQGAKNLSQADTSGKNALTDVLGSTSPSQPGGPMANMGGR